MTRNYQNTRVLKGGVAFLLIVIVLYFYHLIHRDTTFSKIENVLPAENISAITSQKIVQNPAVTFDNMLGVNAFEWNLLQQSGAGIDEQKMQSLTPFTGIRHYLDWGRIEPQQGKYTFNPTHSGSWNLDGMYQRCKTGNIAVLVCLKTCPDWLLQTYPANERDAENVPMPYGADKAKPASYIAQAKAAYQFAARYGSNKNVNPALINIDHTTRWTNDPANEVKTGLGLIKYIECDNERDKWWKGEKAHQTAEEYAANLSAFYDGNKGSLGKGVGVKAADPAMQVVMAGLATAEPDYVAKMIAWCRQYRGYKPDGSINLCFDVINYHFYSNNYKANGGNATQGLAPELSDAAAVALNFVTLANKYKLPVWVTEAGFDVNPQSVQRAVAIGTKTEELTQADWLTRTALLCARTGVSKLFFYELYDDNLAAATRYASSGLIAQNYKKRPAANYLQQMKTLLGKYTYQQTISSSPIVDVYRSGQKIIYVLVSPGQTGKTLPYKLSITAHKQVIVHTLQPEAAITSVSVQNVKGGMVSLTVSETPVFVELN